MLSESSSFIATYCCDLILRASLAPIGGSADDSTTTPSSASLGAGNSAETMGAMVLADSVVVAAALLEADWLNENNGSAGSEAGGGITPSGVAVGPVMRSTHKVGEKNN